MNRCHNFNLCRRMTEGTRCINCDILFGEWDGGKGILKEYENIECPICLGTKSCFEQPKCDHPICADCFRIIYLADIPIDIIEEKIGKEPIHPYQHLLDTTDMDYCDFEDNPEYPLMENYETRINIWFNLKDDIVEQLCTYKCPLCRITNY
jgi:hypothetical protein